jgi:murein DD-endopeptidase MepM/ murein hydrolase activator NlpD
MRFTRVLLFALGLFAVVAVIAQGEGVAQQVSPATSVQRTEGTVVGASIAHPSGWTIRRERYTFDGTYGFTLWRPEPAGSQDHGGIPAVRVALSEKMLPSDIDDEIEQTLAYYQDQGLDVGRETVGVGAKGHPGEAFGPIPGSTPATRVYVPVAGRVYRVDVFSQAPGEEGLDADDRRLLRTLRFERPSQSISSLGLPRANAPEALYPTHGEETSTLDRGRTSSSAGVEFDSLEYSASSTGETRLKGGCWRANPAFWVQTQHGPGANANKTDGIPQGWTRIGVPNFWGQYTHGDLGYGRCNEPYYANDKYAIDYPMDRGDPIWSPFDCGRVTFAGRNETHIDYGRFVSIKSCNGKYFSLTSHFSALRSGLSKGDRVDKDTVLGYAGKSGGPRIPVGPVHFHQVFYRYPEQNPDGSPYGGQGLKIVRHHYVGTAARRKGIRVRSHVYEYGRVRPDYGAYCREGLTCGEGYMISN